MAVLDCRPPLLPGVMNVTVMDLVEIQSSTMASEAATVPSEREQSFGGGDLLSLICPELGVALRIDPGTDLEDELSDLVDSPAAAGHGVAPLSAPADVDIDLEQVFGDVGSLPAMVTPIGDIDERVVVTSPAGSTVVSPGFLQPSMGSVGCPSVLPTVPAVSTPWAGPSSGGGGGGESASSHFPAAPLTPCSAAASPQDRESDAAGGTRSSMTCLMRGRLISTRIVRTPAPRHGCCRAPRYVHSG